MRMVPPRRLQTHGNISRTIKEELPSRNTTDSGTRPSPLIRRSGRRWTISSWILPVRRNPRRACGYGLTEKGLQALRDAADPALPHTYAWFVLTDCNTPQEQIHRGLTLDEAIRLYQDSPRPEKRLGVTKDSIATVDIVRTADGEQSFFPDHQKLDSFRSDPTIFEAVERLHQELDAIAIDPSMTM